MFGPIDDFVDGFVAGVIDAVTSFFSETMVQWYNDLLIVIVRYMLDVAAPSTDEISTGFFSVLLGGTLGLANLVIVGVVVLVSTLVLLSIKKDHSMVIGRTGTSMIGLVLFSYLFYRGYALLFNGQQLLIRLMMNGMTGTKDSTELDVSQVLVGLDPLSVTVTSFFGWLFGWVNLSEAFALHVMFLTVLIFYPLTLALRPLGGFFNVAFHAANASMIVVLFAPPLMAAFLFLPIWSRNLTGGEYMAGVATFVGGLLAIATPIVIFVGTMKTSNHVFGNLDTKVAGAVDINSMPAFNMRDVNNSVHDTHMAPLAASTASPVSSVPPGSLMGDIRGVAVTATAVGITAAGHPHVAAVVKAADTAATRGVQKYKEKGGGTR